jgi:glycine/D-amino acid oxidase-like deaminating enzyme
MKKSRSDIVVIGGGVIGLACAWRLAQGGAQVQLFEKNTIGQEASHAAAGMLAAQCEAAVHPPSYHETLPTRSAFFELCLQSRSLYPAFAEELLATSGIDIELSMQGAPTSDWREPGILYISNLRDEGQVDNRKLVAALRLACERAGVLLHENSPLTLEEAKSQGHKVLLCGGAWSALLAPHDARGIRPIAGEVLSARPDEKINRVLYSRDVYLVPRRDGRVLIGATMVERGYDKTTSAQARELLLEAASGLVPTAKNWNIEEHWTGLRPASIDGLPMLGKTAQQDVLVATGHFRNGILLTPITARLIADAILNDSEIPDDFSASRLTTGVLTPCA